MKKTRRTLAILLLFALLFTMPGLAASLGDQVLNSETELARGLALADGVYWGGSDFRNENYLLYTPSAEIQPIVVYGSKLCNYGSFSSMTKLLEGQGYHVIGGINADYYDVATYCPLGIVIRDGKLISSDAGHYALGFLADGTAITGTPALQMQVTVNGEKFPLGSINKVRSDKEFALFTEDFSYNTKNKNAGRDVVLSLVAGGDLTVDCQLTLQVEEVLESSGAIELPAGKMVLSLSGKADAWRQGAVDGLQPGDSITLTVSSGDSRWADVQQASGSLYKLVENGQVVSGLPAGAEPRTAVGVKADGSTVLYTVDGRQSGYSAGASMTQVAQRLIELGCVEACLMDGGGSTSLNAVYIGDNNPSQVNRPSSGSARSVTSYIMLVTRKNAGTATRLGISPRSLYILTGAQTTLEAGASDDYGWAAAMPKGASWSLEGELGIVGQDGRFMAGQEAASGAIVVSAAGLKNGRTPVEVVKTPHSLTVKNAANGKTVSALQLQKGDTVNLTAAAGYYNQTLIAQDHCFTWAVSGGVGTIDVNGSFRAGDLDASGSILISAGDKQVEIPVTVGWQNPFDDVSEARDWYYEQVKYVCQEGLFSGESSSHFGTDSGMTRGMFVTVLWRIAGSPAAAPAAFSDVAENMYYAKAVAWAAEQGIVAGYGDGSFQPGKTINREEICTLLYNFSNWKGLKLSGDGSISFRDQESISAWARPAVNACVSAGLVNGESNPDGSMTMSPKKTISRAHAAVLLARFHGSYFA